MSARKSRRAVAELRGENGEEPCVRVGERSLHHYWPVLSPYFRDVLLPPHRQPDGDAVSWTWHEPAGAVTPTAGELRALRRRLQREQELLAENLARSEGGARGGGVEALGAVMAGVIGGLVAASDAALGGFVARTEAGLRLHSWGAARPAAVTFPDEARDGAAEAEPAGAVAREERGADKRRRRWVLLGWWTGGAAAVAGVVVAIFWVRDQDVPVAVPEAAERRDATSAPERRGEKAVRHEEKMAAERADAVKESPARRGTEMSFSDEKAATGDSAVAQAVRSAGGMPMATPREGERPIALPTSTPGTLRPGGDAAADAGRAPKREGTTPGERVDVQPAATPEPERRSPGETAAAVAAKPLERPEAPPAKVAKAIVEATTSRSVEEPSRGDGPSKTPRDEPRDPEPATTVDVGGLMPAAAAVTSLAEALTARLRVRVGEMAPRRLVDVILPTVPARRSGRDAGNGAVAELVRGMGGEALPRALREARVRWGIGCESGAGDVRWQDGRGSAIAWLEASGATMLEARRADGSVVARVERGAGEGDFTIAYAADVRVSVWLEARDTTAGWRSVTAPELPVGWEGRTDGDARLAGARVAAWTETRELALFDAASGWARIVGWSAEPEGR